jgi:rRNA maturation endonuclease Nob1
VKSTITHPSYGAYEVICGHCGEEFEVSVFPEYCVLCGKELTVKPARRESQQEKP